MFLDKGCTDKQRGLSVILFVGEVSLEKFVPSQKVVQFVYTRFLPHGVLIEGFSLLRARFSAKIA